MNTKVTYGLVALAVVAGAVFFYLRHTPATLPAPLPEPAATSTQPTLGDSATTVPRPVASTTKPRVALVSDFDPSTLTSTSNHPIITGTANVPTVQLVINNDKGVGLVGGMHIPVKDGHWSYACPISLAPGTYRLLLVGGDLPTLANLIIKQP